MVNYCTFCKLTLRASTKECCRYEKMDVKTDLSNDKNTQPKSSLNAKMSPIVQFYAHKSIFITGATGFLGGVVLEKLLHSCDDLKTIFVLIRNKKGKSMKERYDDLIRSPVFQRLRKEKNDALKKIVPIAGDIVDPQLGMSVEDQILVQNKVAVVMHIAASVNFDATLDKAITLNTDATVNVVQFCKTMKQLQVLVYVSTAYSFCNRGVVDETVYSTHSTLDNVKHILNHMPNNRLIKELTENRPNTYTYTKALAEEYIVNNRGDMTVTIVRPSVIISAIEEPIPGWVEGTNGANGIVAVMGQGLLRSWYCDPDVVADLIPVDIVSNLVITAAWDSYVRSKQSDNAIKVFNCCSGLQNPINVKNFLETSLYYGQKHLFDNVIGRPSLILTKSRLLHSINLLFLHFIPAFIIDVYYWIIGNKFRFKRVQKKIWRLASVLEYFSSHQFIFIDNNVKLLHEKLSKEDQQLFNFNVKTINWNSYLENYMIGLRILMRRLRNIK